MSTVPLGEVPSQTTHSQGDGKSPARGAETDFDRREDERRAKRIAAYDRIAEWRSERVAEHHYYSEQVRSLVSGLILPGSSVLEVGCGLGDLLAIVDGPRRVGMDLLAENDRTRSAASP